MAYPRSFLGLLLTGLTLVALPLVGALAYSAWNTERLAEQSRSAVFSASQAARASRALVNRIGSIERMAQQIAVLDDAEIAEVGRLLAGYGQQPTTTRGVRQHDEGRPRDATGLRRKVVRQGCFWPGIPS